MKGGSALHAGRSKRPLGSLAGRGSVRGGCGFEGGRGTNREEYARGGVWRASCPTELERIAEVHLAASAALLIQRLLSNSAQGHADRPVAIEEDSAA